MKIAVLNFSGNVGKTTIAKNLLLPRLKDTHFVAIESINHGNQDDIKIKSKDFSILQDELLINDNIIVDIGASNIEETMKLMEQYKGSHEDFDYFLLPTVADHKQQLDTLSTAIKLIEIGVKPNKIRFVLNIVNDSERLQSDFERILDFAKKTKIKEPKVGIESSEVYPKLTAMEKTIDEILAIQDLREKLKSITNADEKRQIASLIGIQRLAMTAKENLDEVFSDLSLK
ncbi:hypothetical protein LP109_14660 (plasmid) [Moraxella bovis]|uniref:StbB n=1 Tax=Moraxella bovis TaxID=476 RepID=A0ABY6MDC7_MORBO|nr:StbB family protein [Moraxella bovis]UYZ77099.1 hypothetical protein LP093_14095 [Moraxella bovis]UYZ79789.1 hypothetical protein LP115_14095 [Moraxella bovis]UYZ88281.1 hypothetical protein LP094_14170 [Moraxella bovis]UYZ91005.1 hypothetical protein LP114_14360 [Moraxella bovis]UYZ99224.1 hypothetical protein LP107_14050 [Moraxella bovis]